MDLLAAHGREIRRLRGADLRKGRKDSEMIRTLPDHQESALVLWQALVGSPPDAGLWLHIQAGCLRLPDGGGLHFLLASVHEPTEDNRRDLALAAKALRALAADATILLEAIAIRTKEDAR